MRLPATLGWLWWSRRGSSGLESSRFHIWPSMLAILGFRSCTLFSALFWLWWPVWRFTHPIRSVFKEEGKSNQIKPENYTLQKSNFWEIFSQFFVSYGNLAEIMLGRWAKIFVDLSIFFGSVFTGIAYIVSPGKRRVAQIELDKAIPRRNCWKTQKWA